MSTTDAKFVTRRARACGYLASPDDRSDKTPIQDYLKLARVIVICTMVDIGDPRFRLWLGSIADCRTIRGAAFTLEIFDPHEQAQTQQPSSA